MTTPRSVHSSAAALDWGMSENQEDEGDNSDGVLMVRTAGGIEDSVYIRNWRGKWDDIYD